ncbi:hypothetical protein [Peribacillus sp. NPDC101480]|uniref:hypothetical protein n=1 Tax=Peribacillus sp. NPDC101480 TaxID=3390620 RepID=UPI003D05F6DD
MNLMMNKINQFNSLRAELSLRQLFLIEVKGQGNPVTLFGNYVKIGVLIFERRWNMSQDNPKTKIYLWLSVTLLLCGIVSWIPYLVFKIEVSYGMLTFVLNPIGVILGSFSNNRLIAFSNLFMVFSFIPVMIFVYLTKGYIPM